MPTPMKIDFVSDVSCPWCLIGLGSLQQALARTTDAVTAEIHFQPFELNPDMAPEGEDLDEHIARKYGRAPSPESREMIRARAAESGFAIAPGDRRIYNTFDAHRLLHWAGLAGRQAALKKALFEAYFSKQQDPSDHDTLIAIAAGVGLDADEAREVLKTGRYAEEVRAEETRWRRAGIDAVPAIIINDKYLISGGQPAETFEQAIRQIAAEAEAAQNASA